MPISKQGAGNIRSRQEKRAVDPLPKRHGILYPLLLMAAILLIICSVIGIVSIVGLIPDMPIS